MLKPIVTDREVLTQKSAPFVFGRDSQREVVLMQKVYVILYQEVVQHEAKISQEAYSTFEEAKQFCLGRVGPNYRMAGPWVYYTRDYRNRYEIVEVTIK